MLDVVLNIIGQILIDYGNLVYRQDWVSSFLMGMEIFGVDVWALFFMGMEIFFLWVGYMFGSLLNEFMEMKDFFLLGYC